MYSFICDYSEGAHPRILDALVRSNLEQVEGYGEDTYTQKAVELIKQRIGKDSVDIHLIPGGTQTNLTAISAFLRPHHAAVAAGTGHILVHETGAIEATGHKIISLKTEDGKLGPSHVKSTLEFHTDEHMVKPKLVYISNSTEIGSVYTKNELENLSGYCREKGLFLYMDGARLGSALCSEGNDLDLSDLADLTDAFYIGGTKNGALIGEALVICRDDLKEDFRFHMKQRGALLAKGKLLGIQFVELFRDNLFFELAHYANKMAGLIRDGIEKEGFEFLTCSPSNQIFPILPNRVVDELQKKYGFYVWGRVDDEKTAIRLVTSWATKEETVSLFIEDFKKAVKSCK